MSLTPYYQDAAVTLFAGDALTVLCELPTASVQTCITSPPYWGLRDYGVPPLVWGGDPACPHDWGGEERGRRKDMLPPTESSSAGRVGADERQGVGPPSGGYFCLQCGAWRGCLGLEPTPELYVAHLMDVFREVWRVLRDDGTCWLNLGDSYITAPHESGSTHDPKWPGGRNRGGNIANRQRQSFRRDRLVMGDDAHRPAPGLKSKDMVGIPWRVAFALQADGWWLRSDIIWAKPNPLPESVTDRPTKAHEYLFLLAKSERYYYDAEAIKEPATHAGRIIEYNGTQKNCGAGDGVNDRRTLIDRTVSVAAGRNRRTVWEIATQPYPEAHFATFPVDLVKPCVLAGSKAGDTLLDPFVGSGTTCYVAKELGRQAIGIDLKPKYLDLAAKRLRQEVLPL